MQCIFRAILSSCNACSDVSPFCVQGQIRRLQQGIVGLALVPGSEPGSDAEMQVACMLDLWLRLMHLMSLTQKAELQNWLGALNRESPLLTNFDGKFCNSHCTDCALPCAMQTGIGMEASW